MKATAERILSPLAIPSGFLLSTLPFHCHYCFHVTTQMSHTREPDQTKNWHKKKQRKKNFHLDLYPHLTCYVPKWKANTSTQEKRQEARNCSPLQQPACTFSIASSRLCVCSWDQMRQITQKVFLPKTYKEERKRKKIPLMEEHWAVQLWIRPSWCPMGTCQLAGELPQMEHADLLAASPSLLRMLSSRAPLWHIGLSQLNLYLGYSFPSQSKLVSANRFKTTKDKNNCLSSPPATGNQDEKEL